MWRRAKAGEGPEHGPDHRPDNRTDNGPNRDADWDRVPSANDPAEQLRYLTRGLDPLADDYAIRLTDRLLRLAVAQSASDIHLDSGADGYLLRFRIDGQLRELGWIAQGKQASVPARIKALAGMLTYRCDLPQEGRMKIEASSSEARVVTLPTLHGERIVIRLIAARQSEWQLSDLGLPPVQLRLHEQALSERSGVILFTGPVGSGKTTTSYAALRWISKAQPGIARCVVSLEDPIESEIAGVAQSQIDPSVGYDWAMGLRTLLRQDPDVIFIGEIRDASTAQLAFRASMTGQLVITTMHARSPCDALIRLTDMQVPSQHLLSSLRLLTCQRLVACDCDCQGGCAQCHYTRSRGRRLQCEILPPLERELARLLASGAPTDELQAAVTRSEITNDTQVD